MLEKKMEKTPQVREFVDPSKDYQTILKPEFLKFDKDKLLRGWKAATSGVGISTLLWYAAIFRHFGQEAAMEIEREVWTGPLKPVELGKVVEVDMEPDPSVNFVVHEMRMMSEWLDIKGNDVETLTKLLPCSLGTVGHLDYDHFDLKHKNHAIATVLNCRWLDLFEDTGQDEFLHHCCWELEPAGFAVYAHYINPKINTIPRVLPPRKSKSEIACQWEYILEE